MLRLKNGITIQQHLQTHHDTIAVRMIRILAQWFLQAIALVIVSSLVDGFVIRNFVSALMAVFVISIFNLTLKPLLIIFTLPITVMTFGLFLVLINAVLLQVASAVTPGFEIHGFLSALIGSIVLSLVTMILEKLVH